MEKKPKVNVKKRNWRIWFLLILISGFINGDIGGENLVLTNIIVTAFFSYLTSSIIWGPFVNLTMEAGQDIEFTKFLNITTVILIIVFSIDNYVL